MCFRALRVLGVLHLCFHHFEVFFEEGMKELRHPTNRSESYKYVVAQITPLLRNQVYHLETIPLP
jgi:hypothetical protein